MPIVINVPFERRMQLKHSYCSFMVGVEPSALGQQQGGVSAPDAPRASDVSAPSEPWGLHISPSPAW